MLNLIFGKKTEKNTEFKDLLAKAYFHIQNREFDKAVALYNEIHTKYGTLPESEKSMKLQGDVTLLFKELTLYMDINEAYVTAGSGDMTLLSKELERIHDLAYEIPNTEQTATILEYASEKYKLFLQIYTQRMDTRHFENLSKKIEKLIHDKKIKEALFQYSHLLVIYRRLLRSINSEKKVELYLRLRKLYKEIAIPHLLTHKTKIITKPIKSKKIKIKKEKQQKQDFDSIYFKIQEALKKGDVKTASELYKHL